MTTITTRLRMKKKKKGKKRSRKKRKKKKKVAAVLPLTPCFGGNPKNLQALMQQEHQPSPRRSSGPAGLPGHTVPNTWIHVFIAILLAITVLPYGSLACGIIVIILMSLTVRLLSSQWLPALLLFWITLRILRGADGLQLWATSA